MRFSILDNSEPSDLKVSKVCLDGRTAVIISGRELSFEERAKRARKAIISHHFIRKSIEFMEGKNGRN